MSQGTGSDIKISKTQIRKAIKHGGSLWVLVQEGSGFIEDVLASVVSSLGFLML